MDKKPIDKLYNLSINHKSNPKEESERVTGGSSQPATDKGVAFPSSTNLLVLSSKNPITTCSYIATTFGPANFTLLVRLNLNSIL